MIFLGLKISNHYLKPCLNLCACYSNEFYWQAHPVVLVQKSIKKEVVTALRDPGVELPGD